MLDTEGIITHSTAILHADTLVILVSEACHSSIEPTPRAVVVLAVIQATGSHVQFVSVPDDGVQRTGVVRVGEVRVLFVRVCVSVVPTTSHVGAVLELNAVRFALASCLFESVGVVHRYWICPFTAC